MEKALKRLVLLPNSDRMNILFYFPTNKRTISIETLMEEFAAKGHKIYLLSQEPEGELHQVARQFGVQADSYPIHNGFSPGFYLRHMRYLVRYVKRHRINLVYSHTQPASIVAVFAQHFCQSRFIICRHHSDYIYLGTNRNAKIFDRIINRLGREFIVPSRKVYHQLTEVEGVPEEKVRLINYAYRFENYPKPDAAAVLRIREKYPAAVLLCAVSRFVPCKRYDEMIGCIAEMLAEGYDCKLLLLGNGPLQDEMKSLVADLKLQGCIFFIGFTTEVIDYIEAADMVIHFSDSEASNSVIKEAGLLKKPVAVCKDVGDFEDYITDKFSGFLLDKQNPSEDFKRNVAPYFTDKNFLAGLGENLHRSVFENYYVDRVINDYTEVG